MDWEKWERNYKDRFQDTRNKEHIHPGKAAKRVSSGVLPRTDMETCGSGQKKVSCYTMARAKCNTSEKIPTTAPDLTTMPYICIKKDNQGNMWVGTYFGRHQYFYDISSQFNYYTINYNSKGLKASAIRQIIEDEEHQIWIASEDGGLYRYNPKEDLFTQVQAPIDQYRKYSQYPD